MIWKCPPLNLINWSNYWKWKEDMVASPCVNKCTYNRELQKCEDCGRTADEISRWITMTDEEKLQVLERLL